MALIDNIVHWWKLDESSGNSDDAVGSQDLTVSGATYTSGKINNGLLFDGTNDTARSSSTTNMPSGTGDWSISLWMKPDGDGAVANVVYSSSVGYNERIISEVHGDMRIFFAGADTGRLTDVTPTQDGTTWYHFVIVLDSTANTLKTYVDNSLVDTQTDATSTITAGQFWLGSHSDGSNDYNGMIDEVGVWSKALSAAEISELYRSGDGIQYPFAINITLTPSTLTLTTSQPNDDIAILASPLNLGSELSVAVPTVVKESPQKSKVGTGNLSSRFLRTEWPIEQGLIAGTTRQTGRIMNLVPEQGSSIPKRNKAGI